MIRINKSLALPDIPKSLRIPIPDNFLPDQVSRQAKNTHKKRLLLIHNGVYPYTDSYDKRYKLEDIKTKLSGIYHGKCAFCEQKIEQFHVEHYRPKQTYCWLAYSWDNLLCACTLCNTHKGVNFDIIGAHRATFTVTRVNLKNINTLSSGYDIIEQPQLVNPESVSAILIDFTPDGGISSVDARFTYTITTCKIDRDTLNDSRRKILDDLRHDLRAAFARYATPHDQGIAITEIVEKFKNDASNPKNEFLAFRRYIITNWLRNEIINAKN